MKTLFALLILASPALGGSISVGVAFRDVTPDYPTRLHGYSSRKAEATRVESRLKVKALAIGSDAQGPAVLISADNLGVPDAIVAEIASRLKAKAGIAREKLAVCASHTHSAPVLKGVAPNIFGRPLSAEEQAHSDRYTREFTDALEKAALDALADRKPASLAWSEGKVDFAVNRRLIKDGKWAGFGEVKDGPVDLSLPMLRVLGEDGSTRAVVVNYACHCTTLNPDDNTLCADWAGFAQEAIENDHRGAIAMTLIGCGADANPKGRTGVAVAQRHGRALADEVNRLLIGSLAPIPSVPTAGLKRVELPLAKLPDRDQLQALVKKGGAIGYNASTHLARLDRGETLAPAIDYPVMVWSFGDDICLVFLAGEVVVDYAIRMKSEYDPKRLWIMAYANDAPCYIASDRILREGGYEADDSMYYYAQPARLAFGAEDLILKTVRGLVPPAFRKKAE